MDLIFCLVLTFLKCGSRSIRLLLHGPTEASPDRRVAHPCSCERSVRPDLVLASLTKTRVPVLCGERGFGFALGAKGGPTMQWYAAVGGIVAESDLSGNMQHEYVSFGGRRVARKDLPGNAVFYYFSDHLHTLAPDLWF